jgi:hypothetical protein
VLTYAEIATTTADLGLDDTDVEELHGLVERDRSSWSRNSTQRPRRA